MSRNDVILGVFAAALVIFSLVVALVIPRRNPGFPGRRLGFFVVLCALFIVAMLAAVEVLGESHDFGAHEETAAETSEGSTGTEPTGTGGETGAATETGGGEPQGNAQAGEEVFNSIANPACGTCHTLEAAGSNQTLGPNLDEALADKDAAFIHESIVDPDAEITEGYADNLMPEDYGQKLTEQQIADLVAFLVESTQG